MTTKVYTYPQSFIDKFHALLPGWKDELESSLAIGGLRIGVFLKAMYVSAYEDLELMESLSKDPGIRGKTGARLATDYVSRAKKFKELFLSWQQIAKEIHNPLGKYEELVNFVLEE